MKKILSIFLALCLCVPAAFALVGCKKKARVAGLYQNGKLVASWAEIKKKYPNAFAEDGAYMDFKEKNSGYTLDEIYHFLDGELVIDSSVKSLGSGCFHGCTRLTSVTIPSSITRISPECFYECTSLSSITIPSSVQYIDESAFYYCSLEYVKIGAGVQWIHDDAFATKDGKNVKTVVIDSIAVCQQSSDFGSAAGCLFYYTENLYILKTVADKQPKIMQDINSNFTKSNGTGDYKDYYHYTRNNQ